MSQSLSDTVELNLVFDLSNSSFSTSIKSNYLSRGHYENTHQQTSSVSNARFQGCHYLACTDIESVK